MVKISPDSNDDNYNLSLHKFINGAYELIINKNGQYDLHLVSVSPITTWQQVKVDCE